MNPVSELEDLYERLFGVLPAGSKGRSTENSTMYAPAPDPRRAPINVEVHDLIEDIETDLPDLARWVCSALSLVECVAAPWGSDRGRVGDVDPKTLAAFTTLRHHWFTLEDFAPTMAQVVTSRVRRLVAKARRLIGETACPIPVVTPCPVCEEPTVFRVDTEAGSVAVCSNPVCRTESGERHRWDETAWEDACHERHRRATAG